MTVELFLYIVAFVLLAVAGFGVAPRGWALGWWGLALVVFAALVLPSF